MITVLLYGFLGKRFGKKHVLSIKTPAEAVRALSANYPEFKKSVIESSHEYKVISGKEDRTDELSLHLPVTKTIKIIPVVAGSGSFGRILVGAALIGASFFLPTTPLISGFTTSLSSIAAGIGFSLVLGGIAQMLFSPPKTTRAENERPENKPSYAFNGAVNTTGQGNPIPLAYGRKIRVGSQVISAGLSAENLAI